jgi:hypothetical protein
MRFYKILFFCLLLFLLGCNSEEKPPVDVLNRHHMALLLMDMHIIDGTLYNMPQQPDTLAKHGLAMYYALFKAYHTDSTQFKKSLRYYTTHPIELNLIYNGILDRLKVKADSLQKIANKIAADSAAIKKITAKADSMKKVGIKKAYLMKNKVLLTHKVIR